MGALIGDRALGHKLYTPSLSKLSTRLGMYILEITHLHSHLSSAGPVFLVDPAPTLFWPPRLLLLLLLPLLDPALVVCDSAVFTSILYFDLQATQNYYYVDFRKVLDVAESTNGYELMGDLSATHVTFNESDVPESITWLYFKWVTLNNLYTSVCALQG